MKGVGGKGPPGLEQACFLQHETQAVPASKNFLTAAVGRCPQQPVVVLPVVVLEN